MAVLAGFAASCGDGRDGFDDSTPANFDVGSGADAQACTQVQCSRDLRSIVDACNNDRVLRTCDAEQACNAGMCVPACAGAVSAGNSIGCDFGAPVPESIVEGSCFAVIVSNTWATPAKIEAQWGDQALDVIKAGRLISREAANGIETTRLSAFDGNLAPGLAVALFLAEESTGTAFKVACPEVGMAAVQTSTVAGKTGRTRAFRVKATVPVSAYSIFPYGGALSYTPTATLLLPVAAWGTRHMLTQPIGATNTEFSTIPPVSQWVAAEDGTELTIRPSADIQAGAGVDGAKSGEPVTYRLSKNEVLTIRQNAELTGTVAESNKPLALFGGHTCMYLPEMTEACDASSTQIPSLNLWGSEIPGVGHRPRPHGSYYKPGDVETAWRLTAAVDGTLLSYDPLPPFGAPSSLRAGETVTFNTAARFVVKSQDAEHPIALYELMGGGFPFTANEGDPDMVLTIPGDQFLNRYVFFVDPAYRSSHIVLVRRAEGTFRDVKLDCGVVSTWMPVDDAKKYEFAYVDFDRYSTSGCAAGRHEVSSEGPFSLTVWGTDTNASYAYPVGMGLRALNTIAPRIH